MARKAAWEDIADADLGPYGKSRGTSWGRVFAGLLFVAVATFVAAYYLPLVLAHKKLAEQYRELSQNSQSLSDSASKAQQELKAVTAARDQLQAEHDARESTKKAGSEQQERVRAALAEKLDRFVKKGNVALRVNSGSLFVAFDSALLFVPQRLELAAIGRATLCDVVKASQPKTLIVRASLGAGSLIPPALIGSYPSPWALSAARAAAVAQGLEQACNVSASQLSVTSTGTQQPPTGLKLAGDSTVELELGPR
jgi:chemotaxis protein MotB